MVLFPPQHVEPGHAIIVSHVGAVGDSCESSVIAVTTELPPGFLTLPADGDRSVAQLERKLSLLVLETLLTVRAPGLPLARLAAFLTQIARSTHKNALLAALANADVRTPLLALRSGLVRPEVALADAVPALLAALGKAEDSFLWDAPVSRLFDARRHRVTRFDPPAQGLLLNASGAELRSADGRLLDVSQLDAEPELFPLASGPLFALADDNPLSMMEEHPEKSGNAIDLGGRPRQEWTETLDDALGVIATALPALSSELCESVQRFVPVGYHAERHLSASYREAPGIVYLTLHPSLLTMAEAIVHESQHGKLNVLRWFDPVLQNGDSAWSASPVRPDLRPLWGVLLAVHAFVPVAALHLVLAEQDHPLSRGEPFARRRAEVLSANEHGLSTLRKLGEPTPVGKKVLTGLEEIHAAVSAQAPSRQSDATVSALG